MDPLSWFATNKYQSGLITYSLVSVKNLFLGIREIVHFSPRIIEYYSIDQTMYSGDVFASGTPDGTGMEKKNGSWFLQVGDTVELEIAPIGKFSNLIVAKPAK